MQNRSSQTQHTCRLVNGTALEFQPFSFTGENIGAESVEGARGPASRLTKGSLPFALLFFVLIIEMGLMPVPLQTYTTVISPTTS